MLKRIFTFIIALITMICVSISSYAEPTLIRIFNQENGAPNLKFQEMIDAGLANPVPASGTGLQNRSPELNPELFCDLQGRGYRLAMLSDFASPLKGKKISDYTNGDDTRTRAIGGLTSEWSEQLEYYQASDFYNAAESSNYWMVTGSLFADIRPPTNVLEVYRHGKTLGSGSGGFSLKILTGKYTDKRKYIVTCLRDI